jgi:hypothetical protein
LPIPTLEMSSSLMQKKSIDSELKRITSEDKTTMKVVAIIEVAQYPVHC